MTEQEIQEWTLKQNKLNPAWAPYEFEPKPEPETETDEEYLAWLAKQNEDAGDEIIVPPVTDATLFENELSIFNYINATGIENPVIALESESLIPWINRWIDEQTARPLVLSFGAFNHWSQTNHDLFFTKTAALDAYEEVLETRYLHRFESPRIIKAEEWIKFFQQYGASGIVGGSVDREARIKLEKFLSSGAYFGKQEAIDALSATYYFSDPGEAAFARMAF
jgi:hypothetical protein